MWAASAESGELGAALITAVWAFLGVVVTTLGLLIAPIIKSRFERTTAPSPAPTDGGVLIQIAKEQGALVQRADDSDERFEVFDRARARDREDLDDVLGFLDRNEPGWRNR